MGNIECIDNVYNVWTKPHAGFEGKGRQAASNRVGMDPDMVLIAFAAGRLPVPKR